MASFSISNYRTIISNLYCLSHHFLYRQLKKCSLLANSFTWFSRTVIECSLNPLSICFKKSCPEYFTLTKALCITKLLYGSLPHPSREPMSYLLRNVVPWTDKTDSLLPKSLKEYWNTILSWTRGAYHRDMNWRVCQ